MTSARQSRAENSTHVLAQSHISRRARLLAPQVSSPQPRMIQCIGPGRQQNPPRGKGALADCTRPRNRAVVSAKVGAQLGNVRYSPEKSARGEVRRELSFGVTLGMSRYLYGEQRSASVHRTDEEFVILSRRVPPQIFGRATRECLEDCPRNLIKQAPRMSAPLRVQWLGINRQNTSVQNRWSHSRSLV